MGEGWRGEKRVMRESKRENKAVVLHITYSTKGNHGIRDRDGEAFIHVCKRV
jgi:hypothetical protein